MKKIKFHHILTAGLALLALSNSHAMVNGVRVKSKTPIAQATVSIFNDRTQGYCTGTLIDPHWIVTAAHCLTTNWADLTGVASPRNVTVIFGEFQSSSNPSGKTAGFVAVHPGFKGATTVKTLDRNDIALVRIDSKRPKTANPIAIISDTDFHGITPGSEVILAGYGMTSLRDSGTNKRLFSFATTFASTDEESRIVRVVPHENKPGGNCPGDSGGPGFIDIQGQLFVWGVASTAHKSCVQYGDYVNIAHYADWIKDVIEKNPSKK